jgi:hypothetical protein
MRVSAAGYTGSSKRADRVMIVESVSKLGGFFGLVAHLFASFGDHFV